VKQGEITEKVVMVPGVDGVWCVVDSRQSSKEGCVDIIYDSRSYTVLYEYSSYSSTILIGHDEVVIYSTSYKVKR
jgi:hypothetical protein